MKSTFNRERLSNPFIINDEAKFAKKLAKIMLNSFATKLIKQGLEEEEGRSIRNFFLPLASVLPTCSHIHSSVNSEKV